MKHTDRRAALLRLAMLVLDALPESERANAVRRAEELLAKQRAREVSRGT